MDELICMKMLKINVNFRIKMKTSFYFIELQLVFSNIDFLEDDRINSHKNALNHCRVQRYNENKL